MRLFFLAAFVSLAALGSAAAVQSPADGTWQKGRRGLVLDNGMTPGMTGQKAAHITGDAGLHGWISSFGALTRRISLDAWRGQRVRVSLRLKREGDMRAYVYFYAPAGQSLVQKEDSGTWETHDFVTDVPARGGSLKIDIGLVDKGGLWVDDVMVQAVGTDVALDTTRRFQAGGGALPMGPDYSNNAPRGNSYYGGNADYFYNPPMPHYPQNSPPAPNH